MQDTSGFCGGLFSKVASHHTTKTRQGPFPIRQFIQRPDSEVPNVPKRRFTQRPKREIHPTQREIPSVGGQGPFPIRQFTQRPD